MRDAGRKEPVGDLAVNAEQLLGDVRIDARQASHRVVQRARPVDEHMRQLSPRLETPA